MTVLYDTPLIVAPNGVAKTRQSLATTVRAGEKHISTYGFEHPYELVAGDWTITIEQADKVLLRHTFHVRTGCPATTPN